MIDRLEDVVERRITGQRSDTTNGVTTTFNEIVRRPNIEEIVDKINEIIDYINALEE